MVLGLDWGMKAWRSESDTEHDEKYHHPSFHFPPFTSLNLLELLEPPEWSPIVVQIKEV